MMFGAEIILSSAGSLVVAVFALFSGVLDVWLTRRAPKASRTGWEGLRLAAVIYFSGYLGGDRASLRVGRRWRKEE